MATESDNETTRLVNTITLIGGPVEVIPAKPPGDELRAAVALLVEVYGTFSHYPFNGDTAECLFCGRGPYRKMGRNVKDCEPYPEGERHTPDCTWRRLCEYLGMPLQDRD